MTVTMIVKVSFKWWVMPFIYLVCYPLAFVLEGVPEFACEYVAKNGIKVKIA